MPPTFQAKIAPKRGRSPLVSKIITSFDPLPGDYPGFQEKNDSAMNSNTRSHIKPGLRVRIVLKKDQPSGKLTEGIVKDILTSSPTHPHGIKVRLESGAVGRVKEIVG